MKQRKVSVLESKGKAVNTTKVDSSFDKQTVRFTYKSPKVMAGLEELTLTLGLDELPSIPIDVAGLVKTCPAVYVFYTFFKEFAKNAIDASNARAKHDIFYAFYRLFSRNLIQIAITHDKETTTVQLMNKGVGFSEEMLKNQGAPGKENYCNIVARDIEKRENKQDVSNRVQTEKFFDPKSYGGRGKGLAWAAKTLDILSGRLYVKNTKSGVIITLTSPSTVKKEIIIDFLKKEYLKNLSSSLHKAMLFFGPVYEMTRSVKEADKEDVVILGKPKRRFSKKVKKLDRLEVKQQVKQRSPCYTPSLFSTRSPSPYPNTPSVGDPQESFVSIARSTGT